MLYRRKLLVLAFVVHSATVAFGVNAAANAAYKRTTEAFKVTVIKNETTIREFSDAIIAAGYDCPHIMLAFTEYHKKKFSLSMVYCGIGRQTNEAMFPPLLYRVTRAGGPLIVVPW